MTNKIISIVCLLCACCTALAQTGKREEDRVAQAGDARCRKEVKDYLDTLRFLREAAGAQIGNRVAQGFLAEKDVEQVVTTQGHCAAAALLRGKGLPR